MPFTLVEGPIIPPPGYKQTAQRQADNLMREQSKFEDYIEECVKLFARLEGPPTMANLRKSPFYRSRERLWTEYQLKNLEDTWREVAAAYFAEPVKPVDPSPQVTTDSRERQLSWT